MEPIAVLVVDRDESTRSELAEFVTSEFDADVQTAESVVKERECLAKTLKHSSTKHSAQAW